jgi:hypothetical protein
MSKWNYKPFKRRKDRETLERIKRWPKLIERFTRVRIFSVEHDAFWKGTGQGYTDKPEESTPLPMEDAFKRTKHCGKEKMIQFVNVENTRPAPSHKEIRERLEKATPEPWEESSDRGAYYSVLTNDSRICDLYELEEETHDKCEHDNCRANADFIAHAPADIRTLLTENTSLKARVEELTKTLKRCYRKYACDDMSIGSEELSNELL